jgi:hypothetical protein
MPGTTPGITPGAAAFQHANREKANMKTIAIIAASLWFAGAAMADDSCQVQATGKNLHGAALASFAKKCCNDQATAQKLHGAAAASFTKKCVADATGAKS